MKIDVINDGPINANCYILSNGNKVLIIDPGANINSIMKIIADKKVAGVLTTHNHFDHIDSLNEIVKTYNVLANQPKVEGFNYELIKTPGHSKDSQTIYFPKEKIMFTGDFIFKDTIGYTHFPGGNNQEMIDSLNKISNYPNDIKIYPGHADFTILGEEKQHFPSYIDYLSQ